MSVVNNWYPITDCGLVVGAVQVTVMPAPSVSLFAVTEAGAPAPSGFLIVADEATAVAEDDVNALFATTVNV